MKNNLKIARQAAGYTQSELAYICNVTRETIIRLERGENISNAFLLLKLEYVLKSLLIYHLDEFDTYNLNCRIDHIRDVQRLKADAPCKAERR